MVDGHVMAVKDFRYLNDLILRRRRKGDGSMFILDATYAVAFVYDSVPVTVHIPPGFATDGPSVPGFLRSVVSALGPWFEAAVVHDYLYQTGHYSRKVCDQILLAGMEAANVGWWTRTKIYRGVRLGGFVAWNKHRNMP